MAGSYNHIVDDKGNLIGNEKFSNMIENLGDAYEMAEELYGMIWWLAYMGPGSPPMPARDLVEKARQNYHVGLALAQNNERNDHGHQPYRPS